jgi:hypothetical protein
MRTTLTIPDDVLAAARQRAEEQGITIGDAIGELARRGLEQVIAEEDDDNDVFWKGVKFLPRRPGEPRLTTELVNRLLDESH